MLVSALISATSRGKDPSLRTTSLGLGPSPAILPNAQTACSATFMAGDFNNSTNFGIAPNLITTCVCSDVPEAMFVSAQQASNCSNVLKQIERKRDKLEITQRKNI